MARGIKRKIKRAIKQVQADITSYAENSGGDTFYTRGLSSEGWKGGYLQALYDIDVLLNGTMPSDRRSLEYWED